MIKATNKVSRQVQLQKILEGLSKRFPSGSIIALGSVSYPVADLEQLVQQDLDGIDASVKAHAQYLTQVELERVTRAKVGPVLRLLKNYVLAIIGDAQDKAAALSDFGYSPRKARKPTVKTKAQAEVKAAATRKAKLPAVPVPKAETPPVPGTIKPSA